MNAPKDLILLDCRGMQCPAPILQLARTARQHKNAPIVLEVQADDQDFPIDVRAWCRTAQAAILREVNEGATFRVWLGLNGASLPVGFGSSEPEPEPVASPAPRRSPAPPQLQSWSDFDEDFSEEVVMSEEVEIRPPASRQPAPVAARQAASQPAPAQPASEELDLRGEAISSALLSLSARLLETPAGVTILVDSGEIIGNIYTWANATRSTVTMKGKQDGADVLFITASSEVVPRPAPVAAPVAPSTLPALMQQSVAVSTTENLCTLLILHNDFEALMAALMVANAAASQMMDVEMYFSFWGINLLRADRPGSGEKKMPFLKRMMAWMMPAGPERQVLGKMNFGGMGTGMMTHFMRKGNVLSLSELMDAAEEQGVKFVGCTMSMGLMGIRQCDLAQRQNLSYGGVTAFVEAAQRSKMSMVF